MNKQIIYKNIFNYKFIFGLFISLFFSYISFNQFNFENLLKLINEIKYLYIFIAVTLLIISVYIRALRWNLLFDKKIVSSKFLFDAELIGYFGNNILPLRLGELLRSSFVSKKYDLANSYVFGTIVLERFLDMMGLLLIILLFSIINFQLFSSFIFHYNYIYIYSLIPFVLLISFFKKNILFNSKNYFIIFLNNLIDGLSSLNKKNISYTLVYTVIIWIIYIFEVYLMQLSLNINLSLSECMFLLILSTVALSIPSSPANVGTFEFSIIYGMTILGYNSYNSEFAVLLHLLTFIPYTLIGGVLFIYNYFYIFNEK